MNASQSQAYEQLRKLLLEEDEKRLAELEAELEALRNQFNDKEALIESLDPVIADTIARRISESRDEMAEALAPVMGAAIKQQVATAKDDIADALYPVIGQTIRKSIAEAMKRLAQTVNERIERALSFQLLFKRLKARLTGVPVAQLILKEALPFTVHEVFLIHKKTGILLSHASSGGPLRADADRDLLSGMLTAIQDFATGVFQDERPGELHEIEYDDRKIVLEIGKYAYLACVVSGAEPERFRERLHFYGDKLHTRFARLLREFDGKVEAFQPATWILQRLIKDFAPQAGIQETSSPGSGRKAWIVLAVLLLAALAWLSYTILWPQVMKHRVVSQLAALRVNHPELQNPGVRFEVSKRGLVVSGRVLSQEEKTALFQKLQSLQQHVALVDCVMVLPPAATLSELQRFVHQVVEPALHVVPDSLRFVADGSVLHVYGYVADESARMQLTYMLARRLPFRVIVNHLEVELRTLLPEERRQIESRVVLFAPAAVQLPVEAYAMLDEIAALLRQKSGYRLVIKGFADPSGRPARNLELSRRRAEAVRAYLVEKGVPSNRLEIRAMGVGPVGAAGRKVTFEVVDEEQG